MKTIKDIAIEARVSPGTVDRVLHNRGGVSKKTEALIKKILKQNNFKINKVARSLAMNKSVAIAALLPQFDDDNIFWKAPYLGIVTAQEEVEVFGIKVGYHYFDQFDAASYVRGCNNVLDSKPEGVIIAPNFLNETRLMTQKLDENKIPYIFINIDLEGFNNITFVGQEAYLSGRLAGKLMHLCLRDGVGVLILRPSSNSDVNKTISKRISGFRSYLKENNVTIKTTYFDAYNLHEHNVLREKLNLILSKNPSIKGIFVPNSRTAYYVSCMETSKAKELAIIGFDGTAENVNCLKEGKATFLISQKPFGQGYDAVKTMTNYILDRKRPERKMYSPIEILSKENVDFSKEGTNPQ